MIVYMRKYTIYRCDRLIGRMERNAHKIVS